MLIELKHATIGTLRVTAENVSAGGLFVGFDANQESASVSAGISRGKQVDHAAKLGRLQVKSRLKVRLLSAVAIEPQATPTVDMVIARVDERGLGLKFANETSRFLWDSAPQTRRELDVGRDYFQVYLSVLLTFEHKVLLLEQRGSWVFPGCYLEVGSNWQQDVAALLQTTVGIAGSTPVAPVEFVSMQEDHLPQAATLRLFYRYRCDTNVVTLNSDQEYREHRWVDRPRVLADLTFAQETDREVAIQLLDGLSGSTTDDS